MVESEVDVVKNEGSTIIVLAAVQEPSVSLGLSQFSKTLYAYGAKRTEVIKAKLNEHPSILGRSKKPLPFTYVSLGDIRCKYDGKQRELTGRKRKGVALNIEARIIETVVLRAHTFSFSVNRYGCGIVLSTTLQNNSRFTMVTSLEHYSLKCRVIIERRGQALQRVNVNDSQIATAVLSQTGLVFQASRTKAILELTTPLSPLVLHPSRQ